MDDPRDWPARLTAPQRNNFFFGKMMGVAQFEREQRYNMGQRWLVNRLTVGTGVLCGLEVTLTADGKRLRVSPGVAIDPWGREIVAVRSSPIEYDPFASTGGCSCGCGCGDGDVAPITEAKDYMLCLTYRECTTNDQPVQYADDCPDQPDCQPDTTVETFCLSLREVNVPAAFDCGAWTAPVAAPPPPPPAEPPPATPPSIAVLRARLAEQLGASCTPPDTNCVPLAVVTAAKDGDQWSLSVADGPRRRIYTQAQLLEMILCLAQCCGEGHGTEVEPFTILGVVFQHYNPGRDVFEFKADLKGTSGTIVPSTLEVDVVRIVFNAKVDLPSARAGLKITRTIGATTTTLDLDQTHPTSIRIDLDPNDPKSLILAHRDETDGHQNPYPPADKYSVTLLASTIKDVPNPGATARALSGKPTNPGAPFPTGGTPGADNFAFEFIRT